MATFAFTVDRAHARSVNETLGDVRRLQVSAVIFAVILGAAAAGLFVLDRPWAVIVGAVAAVAALVSLWVSVWAPRKVGSIDDLYARGPLVPAVVSETHPRGATILALVDIAKPGTTVPQYALVTRNVRALPGHRMTKGERVPSIAVMSDRSTGSDSPTWQMVSPMPIAWGTRDLGVLRRAVDGIDAVEWTLLRRNTSLSEKVRQEEDARLLLAPEDLPAELIRRADS